MAKSLKLIIEALLFASDKPLTARDIRDCIPEASLSEIKSALEVLKYEYETMERSFSVREVAGGYQLRTESAYGTYILKMIKSSPNRLSRAALETLSIIAYKQPIIRQEIESYRGVDVGGILRTLLEKDLIRIVGRKDLPGKPLIYGTTKKFLEVFDLQDLKSLPKLKEIQSLGPEELESLTAPEQLQLQGFPEEELPQPPESPGAPGADDGETPGGQANSTDGEGEPPQNPEASEEESGDHTPPEEPHDHTQETTQREQNTEPNESPEQEEDPQPPGEGDASLETG